MYIVITGLNHRTAPVEIREKLSFPQHSLPEAFQKLSKYPVISGCAVLSTCNRTEVYAATTDVEAGTTALRQFLSEYSGLAYREIKNYLYTYTCHDAVRHLFYVAAGLDSMILGETQILGQVRQAYQWATEHGASNGVLNTLFQQAITVGKRVRTETAIDRHAVSISYAAVELAKQLFGDLTGKTILILGAGEMSELTAKHLVANGASSVMVSNRSYERAVCLAKEFGGQAVKFDQLFDYMHRADIVISCTAATHAIILPQDVAKVMAQRQGRQIFIIDIAVPRDIDPKVGNINGVVLYDIDDLQNVVDRNLEERQKEAVKAEQIIADEMESFLKWLNSLFVVPTIVALKAKGEAIKQAELQRAVNRLGNLTDKEKKVISSLANSIVNQLLHDPITQLKEYAATGQGHLYTEIAQNLFKVEVEGQQPKQKKLQQEVSCCSLPGIN